MSGRVTIKELHALTGEYVRRAGKAHSPIVVTDRGTPVAILGNLDLLTATRRRRILSADFEALMAGDPSGTTAANLDAIRGDR
jgi:antitoxin (DNA-binding transcriptional repressor) of toxin-antitoxin stability system